MQKNQEFTGEITGVTSQGLGVARFEDRAVFVKGAIPGESCRVRIVKITKTAVYGRLMEVLRPSPHRVEPACPHFGRCGGCDYMHMDYPLEAELKRQRVSEVLRRIGGVDPEPLEILPAPEMEGYRNKVQFPVAMTEDGPAAGFFQARTHRLIPVTRCLIQPQEAALASKAVLDWMRRARVPAYDEQTGRGCVRHIFLRKGAVSGQVMVCVVGAWKELPQPELLVRRLRESVPGLTSAIHNVNAKPGNVILGAEYRTLWGRDCIEDTLCGLVFRLSPASFYQVNHHQAQVLYEQALAFADLHGTETVLDLYCGTGTITLCMARAAGQVIGVEVVPQAIEDANNNARRNGISNARFFCADAGEAAKRLATEGIRPDVITVDPPRKGISQDVIDAIAAMAPERVVYVSCDPATLARDVCLLEEKGYRFRQARAVDLFPRTKHVETVCLLSKLSEAKQHIEIDLDLDELDATAAEVKATYTEIKDYVMEHYGLHVSSLYISQVKRKYGLEVGQNYNLAKTENPKVPKCPPEKEAAIMAALEHYMMLPVVETEGA